MKIFDWVHRKFRQNFTQAPTKQHDVREFDRSSHASLVDLLAYDQFSRVKTSGREDRSILKVRLQDNAKVGEEQPCKQGTVEHYVYNVEGCGDRSVQAVLVRDIQHGLLAIGSFGTSNLQPSLKNIDVSESRDKQVSPVVDHVPLDVEEFRKELEKVLYNRLSDEDACPMMNIESGKEKKEQKSEKERSLADKHDRKTKSKKKVFPLRDFLEIPQASSEEPVANKKKKTKKLSSLSNLFNGQKSINRYEKSIHDSQSPKELSPETVDQKRSAASVLKRLMLKSGRAAPADSGESTVYRTGLEKFLQAFRKKGSTSVQSCHICSPRKLSNKDFMILREANNPHERSDSYTVCPPPKQDTISNAGNVTTNNHTQLDLEDDFEPFKFEEWPNEFTPAPLCWLTMKDSSVLNEENGYWIKTDEEYVVLEL